MYTLYAGLATLIVFVLSPVLWLAARTDRWGLRQRLLCDIPDDTPDGAPLVWFHAASIGEVTGLARIVHAFSAAYPAHRVMVTTMTTAGLEHARRLVPHAHIHRLAPLDTPYAVRRAVACFRPAALVLVEGELWPVTIAGVHRNGCPVVLVNARMSDRSFPRNRFIRPLIRFMLRRIALVAVQTSVDAERFVAFGAEKNRVHVTGNIKFDKPTVTTDRVTQRQRLGIPEEALVIAAGCPRPDAEEKAVLDALKQTFERHPETVCIWAPRHPERVTPVQRMLTDAGLSVALLSGLNKETPTGAAVVLVDTFGELSVLYAAADMAFVGATLVPLGGHNLFEPAVYNIPVLFGPHTENVREATDALLQSGGGRVVHNGSELADAWTALIEHPRMRRQMGQAAGETARSSGKALEKTMTLLNERIFHVDSQDVPPSVRPQ